MVPASLTRRPPILYASEARFAPEFPRRIALPMSATTRAAAELLRVLPRKRMSRALGRLADLPVPSRVLDRLTSVYIRAYDVDLGECEVPDGGYATFDAFFTRRLRDGARELDPDPRVVVSPADGRVEDVGEIRAHGAFTVKGRPYALDELLADRGAHTRFAGGLFAIVYLSPRDYHRVHAPVSGRVARARHVAGTLYPVNAIGLAHVPGLFAKNERVAIEQRSELHGEVVTVLVGAVGVGRIGIAFDESLVTNTGRAAETHDYGDDGPLVPRGDELGVFHLGSTVIVFVTKAAGLAAAKHAGESVRMGESLFTPVRSGT